MTNRQVIERFINKKCGHTPKRKVLNGVYYYEGMTLKSNSLELINYSTRIAFHKDDAIYLNIKKYSVTTSKIQSLIKTICKENNIKVIEIESEGY